MVKQFGYSKSTSVFKINIVMLINKQHEITNSSLPLKSLRKFFRLIKEICKENASEFV